MARTKASVGAKISSGKSTKARCSAPPPPSNSGSSSGDRSSRNSYSGGNPWCQREIPVWQKPITNFFKSVIPYKKDSESEETSPSASNSKPKSSKRNVIESDEEELDAQTETIEPIEVDEDSPEKPKNQVLDETIDLEPLTGENSHKMEEYYPITRINRAGSSNEGVDKENIPSSSDNNSMDTSDSNNNSDANEHKHKGKGKGKKTNKDKLNVDKRKSVKRDLEQVIFGEESQHVKKRIKS